MQKAVSYWDQKDPSYSDMIGGSLGIDSDIDVRQGPGSAQSQGTTAGRGGMSGPRHACTNRSQFPADLLVFPSFPLCHRSEIAGSY